MNRIELDVRNIFTVRALHIYLAYRLDLPAHYGKNLDALHDCLTEQKDVEIEVQHEEEMLAALGKYGEKLMQVMEKEKNR